MWIKQGEKIHTMSLQLIESKLYSSKLRQICHHENQVQRKMHISIQSWLKRQENLMIL